MLTPDLSLGAAGASPMDTCGARTRLASLQLRIVALGLALSVIALAACGTDEAAAPPTTQVAGATTAPATVADTPSTGGDERDELDAEAPDLGRVVSVAEEFVLADLLALGIEPVASTATVDTVGFQGLDEFDTSAIEVLPQTTLNLEYLAALWVPGPQTRRVRGCQSKAVVSAWCCMDVWLALKPRGGEEISRGGGWQRFLWRRRRRHHTAQAMRKSSMT